MAVKDKGRKKKAPRADNKTHVVLTFWPYRFQDGHKSRLEKCGDLVCREDGSYALRVERGAMESRARELIKLWTGTCVIGVTKKPPAPQSENRARPKRQRRSGAIKQGGVELTPRLMTASEILSGLGVPSKPSRRKPAKDVFLAHASSGAVMVSLTISERYGDRMFEMLVDLGLYGEAFWLFYRGECFKNEEPDPVGKLFQLLDTGDAAKLAMKYIDEASS